MELLRRIVDKIRQLNKRFQVKHGDLHLNNILIDNNGEPWIIDYGQAEFLSPVNSNSNTSDGDEDVTMFLEELREFKSQLPVVAEFIAHKL
jgi:RIO-like serine/threonine protein kinase